MSQEIDLAKIEERIRRDGRYPPEAYDFLQRGLAYTVENVHGGAGEGARHVSGEDLCNGLRALALGLWGPLAGEVLRRWRISCTRDFGEMVFVLIEIGVFGKQESDELEDFDDVYSFVEAFGEYAIPLDGLDAALAGECD